MLLTQLSVKCSGSGSPGQSPNLPPGRHDTQVHWMGARSVVFLYSQLLRSRVNERYALLMSLSTLASSSGKRIASVWRPSVCLSHFPTLIGRAAHTQRDSARSARDAASVHFHLSIMRTDILFYWSLEVDSSTRRQYFASHIMLH